MGVTAVAPPRGLAGASLARVARKNIAVTSSPVLIARATSGQNPYAPSEKDQLEKLVASVPATASYAVAAVAAAAAAAGGYAAGGRLAGTAGRVAGGLAGAAVVTAAAKTANDKRPSAAAKEVQDILASLDDLSGFSRADIDAVSAKYGINVASACGVEMRRLLQAYIAHVMPKTPQEPLTGGEAAEISAFIEALGVDEQDAAGAFMDYARAAMRSRMETALRNQQLGEQRMFQRIIYVSGQVFGDLRAAFLLPWKRVFPGVTDAQIAVSRRECARQIFVDRLGDRDLEMTREELEMIRDIAQELNLEAESAADVINMQARKFAEAKLEGAAKMNKTRGKGKDVPGIVAELNGVVDFYRRAKELAADEALFPTLRAPTMDGDNAFRAEGRLRDLRDLFQTYLDDACSGRFGEVESRVTDLQGILALSEKEAEEMLTEAKASAYKDLLREAYVSGALERAESKAEELERLCDRLDFDTEEALEINVGLYRQRLEQVLEARAISDEAAAELDQLRVLFCVPDDRVKQMDREVKGREFLRVVQDAFNAGVDGFSEAEREAVREAKAKLRMTDELAVELLKEAGRTALMKFVTASRVHANKLDQAKELKKMVFFSNIVLSPLLEEAKGAEWMQRDREEEEKRAKAQKEIQEMVQEMQAKVARQQRRAREEGRTLEEIQKEEEEEEERAEAERKARAESGEEATTGEEGEKKEDAEVASEADKPKSLQKAEKAKEERREGEQVGATVMRAQKDITIADELDVRDRQDIYKNFLMYCMTGDVVRGPMGVVMNVERDEADFARLSQLGDILGLDQMQVSTIHRDLAEQAFKAQVEGILGSGEMNADRMAKIEDLKTQLGLDDATADKVIRAVQGKRVASTMETFRRSGELTLDRVLEAASDGVDVSDFMGEESRMGLYRTEVERLLSNGEGAFEATAVVEQLPETLKIKADKARRVVEAAAKERRRLTLVQAVSGLRQKNPAEVLRSLNNLISCERALPEGSISWKEEEEVKDLYCTFVSEEKDEAKRGELKAVLGLSDEDASDLEEMVTSGKFKLAPTADAGGKASFF